MKLKHAYLLLLAAACLAGCNKYLESEPKKQASIKTVEQLEALLNTATEFSSNSFITEDDQSEGYSTDNFEITQELYAANPGRFDMDQLYYYTFQTSLVSDAITNDQLWSGEFAKIFKANVVLKYVDEVTGDAARKAAVRADACFIRAYSYWVLANHYCQPYQPGVNDNDPGLPLKRSIDYEESLSRSTLKAVYDLIMADISEALKNPVDDVQDRLRWRSSRKAISAFLSRYYLHAGDYAKCIAFADEALQSQTVQLVDFKTIGPGNPVSYTNPDATLQYSELTEWNDAKYLYWKELYYTRFSTVRSWFRVPSQSLRALYDQSNDLRYRYWMIPNGGRRFTIITPATYRFTFFSDGANVPSSPTIAEVLLNKAEALARTNNATGAMQAVNMLREKRMEVNDPLSATSQDDAISKVLQERRRELPFSTRWYDIRRFAVNNYAGDDVVVTRNFFRVSAGSVDVNTPQVYTLPLKSLRYAVPLNAVEIGASRGQLQQNKY